jgi:transposase
LSYGRHNISELAREPIINVPQLYKWRIEVEDLVLGSFLGKSKLKQTQEQEQIAELERKLKDAELERNILKKAISLFSNNSL